MFKRMLQHHVASPTASPAMPRALPLLPLPVLCLQPS